MLNFSIKKSLLMTTGLLLSSFTTCAADNYNVGLTEEEAFQRALALSAEGDRGYDPLFEQEQQQLRQALAVSAQGERHQPAAVGRVGRQEGARALPPAALQKPKPFAAEQRQPTADELKPLAKSIMARPGAINNELTILMENRLMFIEMPFGAGAIDLPQHPLNLEGIKGQVQADFKRFCETQGFNYGVALPLFTKFWGRIIGDPCFDLFSRTYQNLFDILMENKVDIDARLLRINKGGEAPVIPGGLMGQTLEELFKERLKNLGIMELYEELKRQQDYTSDEFIPSFTRMTEANFWKQFPKIDMANLLVEQMEKKEPEVIRRPALYPALLEFQPRLNKEFVKRERLGGNETVMAYASQVAKHFYKELDQHINAIWDRLELSRATQVKNIGQVMTLHDTVKGKEDLDHTAPQSAAIKATLETSFRRHTAQPMYNYLGDITQYDYLLMVSSQILRFNEAFRKGNKDLANTLLGIFFDALIEQEGACQGGMTGRLLQAHKITLDMLIEYYNTPIKVVPVAHPAAEEDEEEERKAPEFKQKDMPVAPPAADEERKDPERQKANEREEREALENARAAAVAPVVPVQAEGPTYQERLQGRKDLGQITDNTWGMLQEGNGNLATQLFNVINSMPGQTIDILHTPGSDFFRLRINGKINTKKYQI